MSIKYLMVIIYLITINMIGFYMMKTDKKKAIQGAWRIPEANLFFVAYIGGSLGSLLGMYRFRHKTKHRKFVYGMPIILIIQILFILSRLLRLIIK